MLDAENDPHWLGHYRHFLNTVWLTHCSWSLHIWVTSRWMTFLGFLCLTDFDVQMSNTLLTRIYKICQHLSHKTFNSCWNLVIQFNSCITCTIFGFLVSLLAPFLFYTGRWTKSSISSIFLQFLASSSILYLAEPSCSGLSHESLSCKFNSTVLLGILVLPTLFKCQNHCSHISSNPINSHISSNPINISINSEIQLHL